MNENSANTNDNGFTKVACHLCGEEWLIPNQYVEFISAEHPYECVYCKNKLKQIGRL